MRSMVTRNERYGERDSSILKSASCVLPPPMVIAGVLDAPERLGRRRISRVLVAGSSARSNGRSEEHTSELQSQSNLVCRLLLEKKKKNKKYVTNIVKLVMMH